ncbi:RNA-binding protein [Neoasaia chiangmaiensis]|uniref:RNA-binding protein n=1 Tax=Neoasaia chiangmaiensis TaxID=320497 RepID=UPI0021003BA9|nr:RNA-binding protein [Neoasaia chiangmaiensis]
MDDAGVQHDIDDEDERGHLRRCIVTRERGVPETMLRFVVAPGGDLVLDLSARLPGRGIWLSAKRDVVETAQSRHSFAKAARQVVNVPDGLGKLVHDALERRLVESLTLARRAGQALCGFTKCREWIVSGKVGAVVQGAGGSQDELVRLLSGARSLPVATMSVEALAKAFGREHAVYAVVARGALARRLMIEHERFLGLAERPVSGSREARGGWEQAGI